MKYYPYGVTRSGAVDTDKLFTGQRLDQTGLYFYNARYYDATIGRFISPDTIVPNPANPQSLNRYSYCLNHPLKYIDPTGYLEDDEINGILGDDAVGRLSADGMDPAFLDMLREADWDDVVYMESGDGHVYYQLVEGVGLVGNDGAIVGNFIGFAEEISKLKSAGLELQLNLYESEAGTLIAKQLRDSWNIQRSWWDSNGQWVVIGVAVGALAITGVGLVAAGSFTAVASYTALGAIHAADGIVIGGCLVSLGAVTEFFAIEILKENLHASE